MAQLIRIPEPTVDLSTVPGDVWAYSLRELTKRVWSAEVAPSGNLRVSADTERYSDSSSYVKVKEIQVFFIGRIRVYFVMRTTNSSYTAYGRVYKNGIAEGPEQSTTSTGSVGFYQDCSVNSGDLVQLYIRNTGATTRVGNFRLYYDFYEDLPPSPTVIQD